MIKKVIYLCLMVIAVGAFASEKEVIPSTNVTPDFSLSTEQVETVQTGRRGRKVKTSKTYKGYTITNLMLAYSGATMFAYSFPAAVGAGFSVYGAMLASEYFLKESKATAEENLILTLMFFPAWLGGTYFAIVGVSTLASVAVLGALNLFICGIVLWGFGTKQYGKYSQLAKADELKPLFPKMKKVFDRIGISTGIAAGVGAVLTGGGVAALVVNNYANLGYSDVLQNSGVILSVFGGIGLAALPLMISSLGMSAWLKHEECRYSVDIGAVNKDEMQFCMRVKF
jgi:hypothetical protein